MLKIGKGGDFPAEPGWIRREPRMCSDEQGRTSECIHELALLLGKGPIGILAPETHFSTETSAKVLDWP